MVAEKVRIYDIAKNLKLPNKDVIDLLDKKLNIKVKSHSSSIEKVEADKFYAMLNSESAKPSAPKVQEAPPKPSVKVENKEEIKKEVPEVKPKSETSAVQEKIQPPVKTEQPPSQQRFERPRTDRPEGQFRPEGQQRAPFRPDGQNRPQGQFNRPDGQQGTPGQFNRPQGQFRPRPEGFRPRPEGQPGQQGQFNRTDGQQGAPGQFNRPQGQFRPRPEGFRPAAQPGAPGQRPPGQFGGQRPPFRGPRPDGGAPRTEAPAEFGKTPGRRDFGKKKDKHKEKEALLSKEEKFEQAKIAQDKFKKKKKSAEEIIKEKVTEVFIDKPLTVGELGVKLEIGVTEIIKELMASGMLATVNQSIDIDSAKQVSEKLGYTILEVEEKVAEVEEEPKAVVDKTKLIHRAPVVTIMGHVDHGKTTLLDAIRSIKHKIVSTEVGGITQSIGAYTAKINDKRIVFIDTPGHEAFTAMRARGAQTTDIAILVVAADDGIMPQTIESINHAKAAKVPIIIAVNKIDKPDADPDKVLQQLTEYDLVSEKWGGNTITVPVSALQGTNLDELLEYILLVAEVEDLKANPSQPASGVIIEARLDKGKGAVATFLVKDGTLKVGDYVTAGVVGGRVRALLNDSGERVKKALPSTPVEVLGLTEVPQSGDLFQVVASDKEMKTIITQRKDEERTTKLEAINPAQVRKEMIIQSQEQSKDLNIIIKANTHGSAEAVSAALQQLTSKQIFVKVVHVGIGDISEADIMLASASNAIVIGFGVKEDQNALKTAMNEGVDIRKYDIIYQITEDIEKTMLGLLKPEIKEVELGTAEVRQVFSVGKTSKIAGCYVTEGKIVRNKVAKVFRADKEIFKGVIDQLKRFKDDAKEVASGFECGISFSKFNDIQEGDIIKVSTLEEIERASLV